MLKREMQSVNAKILNAERYYGKDSQIVQRIYSTINKAYGTEGRTRFRTIPEGATFKQIIIIDKAIEKISNSAYLSKQGRSDMVKASIEQFKINHSSYSEKQILQTLDFFKNSVEWSKIRELAGEGYSEQYVAEIKRLKSRNSITDEQIDALYNKYINLPDKEREKSFLNLLQKMRYKKDVEEYLK